MQKGVMSGKGEKCVVIESRAARIRACKAVVKISRAGVFVLLSVLMAMASEAAPEGMGAVQWKQTLTDQLVNLGMEAQDLAGSFCPRVVKPTALEFLRNFVLPNRPCVITGAIEDWPARRQWTNEYLADKLGDLKLSVNVTPNGRGDAILDETFFVMPEERQMTFAQFLTELYNDNQEDVFYLSHQNDNLRCQIGQALMSDVSPSIPFVDEALGYGPDAVNLWMGDAKSVTTLHKDHYENLYAVIRGEKKFTLYPPTSLPFLYPKSYQTRKYCKEGGAWKTFEVDKDQGEAIKSWISVNPNAPDYDK
eukprot:764604-Hanusia_phi.AAC.2